MITALLAAMLWKSALILTAALLVLALMRARPAAERSVVARWTVLTLLALPLLALLPGIAVEAPWMAEAPDAGAILTPEASVDSTARVLLYVYCAGVLAVLARVLIGLVTLQRWTRAASSITHPMWARSLAVIPAGVAILVSDRIEAPSSFGWRRPVILIDRATLQRSEQADAIIAHELAHIARNDWLSLMGMHVVAAIFSFNPLVWIAKRLAEQYAEEAADQRALTKAQPTVYAQALLDCARGSHPIVALGISQGRYLGRRMKLILTNAHALTPSRWRAPFSVAPIVAMAACVGAATFVAPVQSLIATQVAAAVLPSAQPQREPAVPVAVDEGALMPVSLPIAALLAPLDTQDAPSLSAANDQPLPALVETEARPAPNAAQQRRWDQNMRKHEARDERRRLRDQAQENRMWLQAQTIENAN